MSQALGRERHFAVVNNDKRVAAAALAGGGPLDGRVGRHRTDASTRYAIAHLAEYLHFVEAFEALPFCI